MHTADNKMLSLSTRELLRRHALLDQLGNNQKLKLADEYINTGYNLVWNEGSYDKAIDALQKALDIQHECHGKHHKDVGHTCSFIGTAFLHKGEHGQALRYFLESRRIFCKAGQGRVKSVDRNIHYVLEKMGLCPKDIAWYQDSVRRVVEHELQADRLKRNGLVSEARLEHKKARREASILQSLINNEI